MSDTLMLILWGFGGTCVAIALLFVVLAVEQIIRREYREWYHAQAGVLRRDQARPLTDAPAGGASPNPSPRALAVVHPCPDDATGEGRGVNHLPPASLPSKWELIAMGGTVGFE